MPMKTAGPGVPRRAIAMGIVVILVMAGSYFVLGREYIAALGASAFFDPTLTFSASRSAAPSGSVIQLAGAPAGAVAEFSGGGVRAYSRTFVDETSVATFVPPIMRGSALASGDLELRLLAPKGPIWTSSTKTLFRVEEPGAARAPLGILTLFGLEVAYGLLVDAADAASTAASAGAPSAASEHADAITDLRLEIVELAKQFELVAWGNKNRVVRSGLTIDASGIRLMDELMRPYLVGLGAISACPAKDALASAGLAAQSGDAAKAAATSFVRSVVECEPEQVRDLARRTSAWTSTLAFTVTEALRTDPGLPKLATILQVAVMSWSDEALSATYLWKKYGHSDELRSYLLERESRPGLPDSLSEAAEQDAYLSAEIERLRQPSFDAGLLESALALGEADRSGVNAALEARKPVLATPRAMPPAQGAGAQDTFGVRTCATLIEYRSPAPGQQGYIRIGVEEFLIAAGTKEDIWEGARVGSQVCIVGKYFRSPTGLPTLIERLVIGAYSPP